MRDGCGDGGPPHGTATSGLLPGNSPLNNGPAHGVATGDGPAHGVPPNGGPTSDPVEAAIMRLTAARGPAASLCPTEVARAVASAPDEPWRGRLGEVRRAAIRLARNGRIDILRKGRAVDPAQAIRGVIRLRVRPASRPGHSGPSEPGTCDNDQGADAPGQEHPRREFGSPT